MKLFVGKIQDSKVEINEEEQTHIVKVLRMKTGELIHITDGNGNLATGTISILGKKVHLENYKIAAKIVETSPKLHIAIAPTKNIDRIEFFVEKATEMGISEISFIITDNTERKLLNIEKIQKQAIAASKQSLRLYFPKINPLIKLSDFVKEINPASTLVAHCNENLQRIDLQNVTFSENKTILVGPEGDFSEKEIELFSKKGIKSITLGKQRLRTETAGIYLSAWHYSEQNK